MGTNGTTADSTAQGDLRVWGTGTSGGGGRILFGNGDLSANNNVWVGEQGTTDSDVLQLKGDGGINLDIGNGSEFNALSINGTDGSAIFKNASDSATAFQIQNQSNNSVFGVDTSAGQVLFGKASTLAGKLVVYGGTSGNVTITVPSTITSYSIALPNATPSTTGLCLKSGATTATNLEWGSCGGGGGTTQTIALAPEYPGATLHADGSNNSGTMTSDYDSTNLHNYYDWTLTGGTSNDYDIIVRTKVPSDFTGSFSNLTIYTYSSNTTNATGTIQVQDASGTNCYASPVSITPSSATAWQAKTPGSFSTCTVAANTMLTITIHMVAKSSDHFRAGEISYTYTN